MKLLVDLNLSPNWLSEAAMIVVAKAIEVHREDIERGALLSIDEGGTRIRMLPLRASRTEP